MNAAAPATANATQPGQKVKWPTILGEWRATKKGFRNKSGLILRPITPVSAF